uniref:Uncharacterized protein n=1 Tax=Arcella intermedia TaxID=1963864 RepID=A0A6B2LUS0_9EUKA
MGKGNGTKSAQKRERNAKKQAAEKKAVSTLKTNQQALSIMCQVCRTTFLANTGRLPLQQHIDSKHEKREFKDCFPTHVHLLNEQ